MKKCEVASQNYAEEKRYYWMNTELTENRIHRNQSELRDFFHVY